MEKKLKSKTIELVRYHPVISNENFAKYDCYAVLRKLRWDTVQAFMLYAPNYYNHPTTSDLCYTYTSTLNTSAVIR